MVKNYLSNSVRNMKKQSRYVAVNSLGLTEPVVLRLLQKKVV